MYVSDIFKPSSLSLSFPTELIWQLLGRAQELLFPTAYPDRAAVHDVLRLDIVSGPGQTPAAYGWHVDSLLNVRLQPASEPLRAAPEPPPDDDCTPPDRGIRARVYRVPRTRQWPTRRVLRAGLVGNVA